MKRRRILAGASALLIGTALLAGCNGGGGSKGTGTYGGVDIAKLEKTDIQLVAHYDVGLNNEKSAIGKTVKWWKENVGGNVSLNVVSADIYPTKIMGMISANNSPDLVAVSSGNWMPRFPVANIIEPVDPYIKKDDLLDYEKMPFEDLSWKGQHYALYTMGSWAQCIWYNKTMFTNNGVKTPREYWEEGNWTWDTFLEVAKELTQDTNNDKATDQWGYANWTPDVFAMANNASMARTNANGTVEIIWDQGPYKNSIQFAQDLMNKHKVTPLDYSYHVNAFKGGTLAMTAGDRSFLKSMCEGMNDEVDNAPLPLGPDQNKDDVRFIGNALFWGLTKGAKNVDGARAFCAKMREFTKELKDEAAKTPGDEEAGLSAEQEEVCDYADSHSRLVYENGFGTWETERWEMWIEATLNNTPVATVLQTFKPIFERNIKDTLEATPQEIEPFTPPPAEGFENKDSILLTRAGLPENGVTAAVTGEGAIGGSSSFKIDYPDTEDWLLAARTDESKVKLPAFHRYVIKFDYKMLSGDTRLNLTIRPKATMLDETVSFGFETIKLKAGESGTYEGHIDVMSPSADNVLLLLGEDTAFSVLIDNLSITEG